MISYSALRAATAAPAARAAFAVLAVLGAIACSDTAGPRPPRTTVRITPVADSVFEGDVVRLSAVVLDASGTEVSGAPLVWTVSDTLLATSAGDGSFTLRTPGTLHISARSGDATASYDLVIGRLAVKRVELTPGELSLGRGDRVQLSARVFAQGDRAIANRTVAYTSDDALVAIVGSPDNVVGAPGFLIAAGPGSTTIRATVDGVSGVTRVNVVIADTTFALSQFNGSPLPVLIASDSVLINGVPELDEVYAESGTFVLSGLAQLRYTLDVRFSQYRVTRVGNTVQRELRFQQREFDRGIVTVGANGSLAMLSEFIGPRLEHTAAREPDGYRVHFRIPGDDAFLDLGYRLQAP